MGDSPCKGCRERDGRIAELVATVADLDRFRREVAYRREQARNERDLRPLLGDGPAMTAVRLAIRQAASANSTILIHGETGTGKELVARAIHQLSSRRDQPFVAVSCAALAPGLVASELFGHEVGAFTGATRCRVGRFELAHRGTIFLDEIGELASDTQVLLLRVLQERVVERVGAIESMHVDVRVVAATNRDLAAEVRQNRFREDLYFRLNVFPIRVPPLRERPEDVPGLVRHFLHHFGRSLGKPDVSVDAATLQVLSRYHWPGNVREMENLIERALLIIEGDKLQVDAGWLAPMATNTGPASQLADIERRSIINALVNSQGRVYGARGAAASLGVKPTTLYAKMRKHSISKHPTADAGPSQ
jgi:formate hydrogenlyase transcriptional activator